MKVHHITLRHRHQAIQEVGRIGKTLHILEYVDGPVFRRRVLIGLNNGEHIHSLARNLAFGRQGRFHDHGYEAQLNLASALSLVINAIGVWNTRHFERAQAELARQGVAVPEDIWRHLSPLQWEHIHLNGSYHFTNLRLRGEFRPLREYYGPHVPDAAIPALGGEMVRMLPPSEESKLDPRQLPLFVEEEMDWE